MIVTHGSWTWNTEDLLQCKQALQGLRNEGISFKSLSHLDFGNLDVVAAYFE